MKRFSSIFTKARKFIVFFVMFVMLFQICFNGQTAKALNVELSHGQSSLDVSVTGFIGTTDDGCYVINDVLAINLPELKNKQFNKFSLNYTASDFVRGTFTYTIGSGQIVTEEFFLEKGVKADFNSLLDENATIDGNRINNIIGLRPIRITFEPMRKNTKIFFNIHSFNYEMTHRPLNDTIYIENDRFKVGVYMAWGGGINYIEDKLDGDDTITNLLNFRDTGRLVQQSYYGTENAPYEPAVYVDTTWCYNPVQGGDQYNNRSKLVDFSIEEDKIYVKCRPLDWAKNNVLTYVYMENTYTIKDDYIEVDNRYIDFSSYDHGDTGRHQELPAFYTISYLDTFTFYNGTKPWTGGALTKKKDLPFWADAKTKNKCYFILDENNTETWCAWTNGETDYGIGLFTPQIELFVAGRCEYDGSKNPTAFSTNYVAPLITTTMRNAEPFQYSYIITAGSTKSIRSTFTEHKDEFNWKTEEELDYTYFDFDSVNDLKGFSSPQNCNIFLIDDGVMKVTSKGEESTVAGKFSINTRSIPKKILGSDYGYLTYTYMVPENNSKDKYSSRIYVCQGKQTTPSEEFSIPIELVCDGQFHTEVINLNEYKDVWITNGGTSKIKLNSINIAYFEESSPGDKMYISCIALAKDEATAAKYGNDAKKTIDVSDPDLIKYTESAEADRKADLYIIDVAMPTPTATPNQSDDGNSSVGLGMILIAVAIGAVVVVAIVAVIVVNSLKKIKKAEAIDNQENNDSAE